MPQYGQPSPGLGQRFLTTFLQLAIYYICTDIILVIRKPIADRIRQLQIDIRKAQHAHSIKIRKCSKTGAGSSDNRNVGELRSDKVFEQDGRKLRNCSSDAVLSIVGGMF